MLAGFTEPPLHFPPTYRRRSGPDCVDPPPAAFQSPGRLAAEVYTVRTARDEAATLAARAGGRRWVHCGATM